MTNKTLYKDFFNAIRQTVWSYVVAVATILTLFLIPKQWYGVVPVGISLIVIVSAFKVVSIRSAEISRLEKANAVLTEQIARLEGGAETKKQKLVADLISELEDDLRTATYPESGPPGNSVYLPPSITCWKNTRNELSFLDGGLLNELRELYAQIERWQGIVASGTRPGLGSPELHLITATVKTRLPQAFRP